MDRHHQSGAVSKRADFATQLRDGDIAPNETARGRRAERHDESGLDRLALDLAPPAAVLDLEGIGFLVQSSLAAWLEFEMLDRIGDEDRLAVQPRFRNRAVEHPSCGADK